MSEPQMAPGALLAAAIDEIKPPTETESGETDATNTQETQAGDETTAEGAKPSPDATKDAAEAEDFSDDRPWTPDRVKKAANAAKDLTQKAHRLWSQAEKRAKKLQGTISELKRDKDTVYALRDQISADIRMLQSGDPAQVIDTLGRMTRMDGAKLYTELSLHMAKGGKKPEDVEREEMKARLDAWEKKEKERERVAEFHENVGTTRRAILANVQNDRWPNLAKLAETRGAEVVAAELEEFIANEYGEGAVDFARIMRHDLPQALQSAELYLRDHPELLQPGAGEKKEAAGSGPGAGPETRAQAKPGTARRTPGQSLAPSIANAPASTMRLETRDERLAALADDPDLWASLGL